jgi:hypothetical protein
LGGYSDVLPLSESMDVDETTCRVLKLDALITAKRAANRPKDRLAVTELEVIKKLREQSS